MKRIIEQNLNVILYSSPNIPEQLISLRNEQLKSEIVIQDVKECCRTNAQNGQVKILRKKDIHVKIIASTFVQAQFIGFLISKMVAESVF